MDLVIFGINGLLLMAIWRFGLKRAILDHSRDQLFDLRDELRAEFVRNGWAMDSELYKRLRDLINGYLRFIDRFSLVQVIMMENSHADFKAVRAARRESFDSKFATKDPNQAKFVKNLRRKALSVVMDYMTLSSGPLALLMVAMLPFVILYLGGKSLISLLQAGGASLASVVWGIKNLLEAALELVAAWVANKILMKEFVEKCSYEQAA